MHLSFWNATSAMAVIGLASPSWGADFHPLRSDRWPFGAVGANYEVNDNNVVFSRDGRTASDGTWRWTRDGGVLPVGFVPGFGSSIDFKRRPLDISDDGTIEVGRIVYKEGRPEQAIWGYYWEDSSHFSFPLPSIEPTAFLPMNQCLSGDGQWLVFDTGGASNPRVGKRLSRAGTRESFPLSHTFNSPMFAPNTDASRILVESGISVVPHGRPASEAGLQTIDSAFAPQSQTSSGAYVVGATRPFREVCFLWDTGANVVEPFNVPLATQDALNLAVSDDASVVAGSVHLKDVSRSPRTFVRRRGEQGRELGGVLSRFGVEMAAYFVIEKVIGLSSDGRSVLVFATSPWYGSSAAIITLPDWQPCPADLNFDGLVDDVDFSIFAGAYDRLTTTDGDLNVDRFTDDADFSMFAVAYDALLCP